MSGWFAVKRGITAHPIFKSQPERLAIWLWLLDNAAWRDTPHDINGKTVTIKRGQVCASERRIATEVGVGRQVVRTFLDRLKAEHMINPDPTHGRTIITLCNYEKYQAFQPKDNPAPNPAVTHDQPTKGQGNKVKKVGSDEPTSRSGAAQDGFQSFWDAYPHRAGAKRGRKIALARYAAAIKSGVTAQTIIDGARRAHRDPAVQRGYARDPAAWLNQAGWQDEFPDNVTAIGKPVPTYGEERVKPNGERIRYVGGTVQWERVYA